MWPWIEDPEGDAVLLRKAERLAVAPRRDPRMSPAERDRDAIDPATAPLLGQRLCVEEIPLAPGCNSAAHVGWLGEDMGQTTSISDARAMLHANAHRDWLWFATHGELSPTHRRIVALLPRWPVSLGLRDRLATVVDDVVSGRPVAHHRELTARVFPGLGGRPGPAPTAELWAATLARARADGRVRADGRISWGASGL